MRRRERLTKCEKGSESKSQQVSESAHWGDEMGAVKLATEIAMETAQTVCKTRELPESASPLEAQNQRLQALVSELILDNQELRFKAAQLETELEKNERGIKHGDGAGPGCCCEQMSLSAAGDLPLA